MINCIFVWNYLLLAVFNNIKFKLIPNRISSKNKIMILIGKIKKGGAERVAVGVAERLSKNNDVIVVTYTDGRYGKI